MTAATGAQASPFEQALASGIHRNVLRILSARSDLRGKAIVDLACGDGRTTHLLRGLGATVTPYDLLPQSYKLADRALPIDIQRRTDIADASADLIIFQEVIEHLPNQLFALQEMHRILKPGGEVLLTTPSRSSLASKLAFLFFESETMKLTPWGAQGSVWLQNESTGDKCYGHLWLIGIQQLRALALVAGFDAVEIRRSELSRSSAFLMLLFYLPLLLVSGRALLRSRRATNDAAARRELLTQFKLNISPANLTSKFLVAVLRKR